MMQGLGRVPETLAAVACTLFVSFPVGPPRFPDAPPPHRIPLSHTPRMRLSAPSRAARPAAAAILVVAATLLAFTVASRKGKAVRGSVYVRGAGGETVRRSSR